MRMSRSPQNGGFQRCTGGGPRRVAPGPPRRGPRQTAASCPDCERHCPLSRGRVRLNSPMSIGAPGRRGNAARGGGHGPRRSDAGDRGDRRAAGAGARDDRPAHHRPGARGRADADRHPLRRPRAAGRRARPRQDPAGRDARHRARARRAPGPVHARPDAGRHPRRRGAGDRRRRQPRLPLHRRADLLPAADGRRDQPRQPAHPVGAPAGDAGEGGLGRRPAADPAAAVPRARDAEPDRAGGHISAARGAARPVPAADRRRLSRARRRARDHPRDHRHRGGGGRAGVRRRRA